jgi:hypothetical protein
MPESDKAALVELLMPVFALLGSRNERKAAGKAGKLRFWKDWMLKELNKFGDGKATRDDFWKL